MAKSWPSKDPDEITDFDINWAGPDANGNPGRAFGDSIVTSTWTLNSGTVVINSNQFVAGATKVWLSGGALGETCLLTNRVVTAGGRTYEQSVKLRIKAK
jgi:hypothetical protein